MVCGPRVFSHEPVRPRAQRACACRFGTRTSPRVYSARVLRPFPPYRAPSLPPLSPFSPLSPRSFPSYPNVQLPNYPTTHMFTHPTTTPPPTSLPLPPFPPTYHPPPLTPIGPPRLQARTRVLGAEPRQRARNGAQNEHRRHPDEALPAPNSKSPFDAWKWGCLR